MATNPGLFSEWPWKMLGSFKYVVLAPWVAHGIQQVATKGWREADLGYLVILPSMILRGLHNQAWITVSRLQNARGKRQIVDRGIEFEQIDRERNWDDQIILSAILLFLGALHLPGGQNLPLWRTDGAVLLALLHAGPVEFLYYWFHRALHHHFLYTRYHSHHHASIVTEPITWVQHMLRLAFEGANQCIFSKGHGHGLFLSSKMGKGIRSGPAYVRPTSAGH
ncbi:unnamed protein product [Triticum turgidum subsp. durum]|uniref:Uncharacterized protein n=1 Tax=Triticum turgidum subsp. durum TaxID=4567 RepID=A0A9R0Q5R3_TRITD|nr:unnamed protein product [Triticum turgidum subsp. durum]